MDRSSTTIAKYRTSNLWIFIVRMGTTLQTKPYKHQTLQSSSIGGGNGILKSSRLPKTWLLPYTFCVRGTTGLLQPSIAVFDGLGKLLGMNSDGGFSGVM